MTLLSVPPEIRAIIFDFCFPPAHTYVQIIPYQISLGGLSSQSTTSSIFHLQTDLFRSSSRYPRNCRRLDFTYIIRGAALTGSARPEYGSMHDDDHTHFAFIMRFAERVRLVGDGPTLSRGRGLSSPRRQLVPGPQCALKVLEGPAAQLAPLVTSGATRSAKRRLGGEGPIWVDLAALDGPEPEVKTNIRRIEAWLKRFEEVTDMGHRTDMTGPLGGYDDEDD
ncbi:hypothetical protein C8R46DRAFT_1106322 [Mycena filopes]|nr:hypothetical protein C8R46DRAFT_1106322 [Mycena filopes]